MGRLTAHLTHAKISLSSLLLKVYRFSPWIKVFYKQVQNRAHTMLLKESLTTTWMFTKKNAWILVFINHLYELWSQISVSETAQQLKTHFVHGSWSLKTICFNSKIKNVYQTGPQHINTLHMWILVFTKDLSELWSQRLVCKTAQQQKHTSCMGSGLYKPFMSSKFKGFYLRQFSNIKTHFTGWSWPL